MWEMGSIEISTKLMQPTQKAAWLISGVRRILIPWAPIKGSSLRLTLDEQSAVLIED